MPTLIHRLARWAEVAPQSPAHRYKEAGSWRTLSVHQVLDRVYYLALFLESKGITSADIGTIYSYNCPEWIHIELATCLLGAKSAGIYPNSTSKDVQYILNHTEAKFLSVQNEDYFKKLTGEQGNKVIPDSVKFIVVFEGDASIAPRGIAFADAVREGEKIARSGKGKSLKQLLDALDPKAGSFMIYTSGTTGSPKGAVLSQDNFCFTADVVSAQWQLPKGRGSTFSFLPLCHVAEKIQNVGVAISQRYVVSFCTSFESLSKELPEAEPSILLCVPRLWEKMVEGVEHKIEAAPKIKQKLIRWAFGVGQRVTEAQYQGRFANPLDLAQLKLADKLVLNKIRAALGLGKAEACASGAAALNPSIARWFGSLGLEIAECFGQTESTGVICLTERYKDGSGTVGIPIVGTEFKIADDGEILTKGRHIFVGYHRDPEGTAKTVIDGWLHTGDLGAFDSRGYVVIKGRKKEVMKTSGGKMIAPLPIEEKLKSNPMISQVCMVGDGRKYLSALITLSEATLAECQKAGSLDGISVQDPTVISKVKRHIDDLNRTLASYEQIKRFTVLSKEFSVVDGEMTPTLKMKRNIIESKYSGIIDQMYHE